jgi:hypothetical protein
VRQGTCVPLDNRHPAPLPGQSGAVVKGRGRRLLSSRLKRILYFIEITPNRSAAGGVNIGRGRFFSPFW